MNDVDVKVNLTLGARIVVGLLIYNTTAFAIYLTYKLWEVLF